MTSTSIVGDLVFEWEQDKVSYRPTKLTMSLEVIAAVGIAVVFLFLGWLVATNRPFDESMRGADTIFCVLYAFILLVSVPFRLMDHRAPYIVDARARTVSKGSKLVVDFNGLTGLRLEILRGSESEDRWQVSLCLPRGNRKLPSLVFTQKTDAESVLTELSALLRLPIA